MGTICGNIYRDGNCKGKLQTIGIMNTECYVYYV